MIRVRSVLLPLLVLSASLCVTWIVWNHERQATRTELRTQFDYTMSDAVSRVEQRMATYELMLRGVQSLFAANGTIDRDRFRRYVSALNLDANFSGVHGVGVVEWVPAARKADHIADMRQDGIADYTIRPDGPRQNYAPIIQREPYIGLARSSPGFDAWDEPVRRAAMEKARDSGMAALTGMVRLTVDAESDPRPGFLMYLPIYASGKAQDNLVQRRANIIGWVYASFRMHDVMASLYGEQPPGVSLAIYDGVEPSEAALLHRTSDASKRSAPALISANEYLVVEGHDWMLTMSASDPFRSRLGRNAEALIAGAGGGLSLLLTLLTWLMMTGRERAMRLASTMTRELRENEEKFRAIADCTVNLEIWWGPDGKPRWINPSVEYYTGYTVEECMEMPDFARTLIHHEDISRVAPEFKKGLEGSRGDDLEFRCVRKDGSLLWLSLSWVPISNQRGDFIGFRTSGRDITERKKSEEKIQKLAFYDTLTRLPNRALLLDRLRQSMMVCRQDKVCGALMFIDLDHFKTLNDTLGHDKGDLLLRQVAYRLSSSVNEGDTVARVGGDEFVVVLGNLSLDPAKATVETEAVGERILAVLGCAYQLSGVQFRSTASIGVTVFNGEQSSTDELFKQADLAMYKSKERGRNAMCFFDPAMQTAVLRRAELEVGLRNAVEENRFVIHYQAQVIDGNHITGAEALVRWAHPERGLIPPGEFIPLAEESGLILEMGRSVLASACAQLALWATRSSMAHLSISVNVSARQFREPDFVDGVLAVIKQTGARADRLKLELTESVLVENVQDIIEKMTALRARGVTFSLDDFGTGYSSLSYLKRLPLDQLKIDRSFVRDILIDPNDADIARTIVALARSFNLGVIAEGVETEAQRDFLAVAGCHAYQGFLFCKPLPIQGFEQFVNLFHSRDRMEEQSAGGDERNVGSGTVS
ncbi:PAS domain S-box-containing protein/diguanylate cyclase (GGDEF)-like protein [Paraburkholderia sp. BL23I1N1]|uniref:bifunctional diguanylate cyclase/phosphodiesterase n=1 Tax=Paraburkholderia sp. BL23I1N1 TaxID=1938802 RepID=UPI000E716A19|nr:EAL domain-containing protein [Paraburkholderia sp. BL23I1N1]RKE37826.1 PAS domain S-box-containing protein/diguanylate cyclase (GGDEF)-like protein [Paraburkholderia sp. BL23I1N1]